MNPDPSFLAPKCWIEFLPSREYVGRYTSPILHEHRVFPKLYNSINY
jgi:hypothetical protein